MDREGILLSELSHRKINTVLLSFKYEYFKQKKTTELMENRLVLVRGKGKEEAKRGKEAKKY